MLEGLLFELANAGGTEIVLAAGECLAEKVKNSHNIKKLFVEAGEFFVDYEPNADQLFDDMALVLSKENMTKLANELKDDSGYTLKDKLLAALMGLMANYDIPHGEAYLYANRVLYTILGQLPEVAPQKYDRFFQSEWREEQKKSLDEIVKKIEKVNADLQLYRSKQIEIYSADQMELQIKQQTNNPKIGIDFFEIDDDNFRERFEEEKKNTVVAVRAKCREEAIFCIINELWRSGEKRSIFIVKSIHDWNKLFLLNETGNIYIPWFFEEEICAIEGNTNIFIYTDGMPSFTKKEIVLRARTYHTLSNALVRAGMQINQANQIISETHGLYIPLKKKIFNGQYLKKPAWLDKLPEKVKLTGLLVGQWTDAEGDKEIIQALSGMKYDEFMQHITSFSKGEDPFIHIIGQESRKSYYLASVENTWEYLDVSYDNPIMKIFMDLFIEVINESEKLFVYNTQEKWLAQIKGEKLFWSANLRNGMIRSLIMKAFYKNDIHFQAQLDGLIANILGYIKNEEQWRYISHFFIDLCEISPKAVLDRMYSELSVSTGLLALFEKQSDDFILGRNDYIDILFGVDEFITQKEFVSRGFEWLLILDNLSFEYKSNSPKDTICKVLCVWHNFSAFESVDEKIQAANMAIKLDKNAWKYIFDALPNNNRSILGSIHKPKYRIHVDDSTITIGEMNQVVAEYLRLLINNANFMPDRWAKLLNIVNELSEKDRNWVFDSFLFEAVQMSEIEQMQVKNAIRQLIYKHRYFASASWAMDEPQIYKFEELLNEIVISKPEYEYVYLFESKGNGILTNPTPYDEEGRRDDNEEKTESLLREKIKEFKTFGLDMKVLSEACANDEYANLGRYFAQYGEDDIFDIDTFACLYEVQESKAMALDYCQGMSLKDNKVFDKVMELNEQFVFSNDFIVALYKIQALDSKDIPRIVSASEDIKRLFWRTAGMYIRANYDWALNECSQYGTVYVYLEILYRARKEKRISENQLYDYLIKIKNMEVDVHNGRMDYFLSELLKPLQDLFWGEPNKAHKLAEIEIAFMGILEWEEMQCFQREIKRSPEIFAELVSLVFKKDGATTQEEQTEEQKKRINALYHLYDMAHFCPAETDGYVDSSEISIWVDKFKELLAANNQSSLFGFLLGRLFAFSPVGEDGHYPCEAVRDMIEKHSDEEMVREYKITIFNKRGVFSPSAGKDEFALAEKYKSTADYLSVRYPKTAEIYFGLYRRYLAESEDERSRAENGQF